MAEAKNIWTVEAVGKAKKVIDRDSLPGKIRTSLTILLLELRQFGPYRHNWPNYTKMDDHDYHCHLKKGKPTYVACWRITHKALKQIEVYYAGTHEKAPY